jgi:hypothetical protein
MWYYKYGMKTKEFNLQFQKTKNRWVARRNPSSRSGWGVEYYPAEGKALSYGWWQFLARIDGQLVINMGSYSRTTTKHQQEVLWKLINDKVNYISINIGDSSLTSIHDVAKSLTYDYERVLDNLCELEKTNRVTAQANRYRFLIIVRLVERMEKISKVFKLEMPELPEITKQIMTTREKNTQQIIIGKKTYNFYNGSLTDQTTYEKMTSKLAALL